MNFALYMEGSNLYPTSQVPFHFFGCFVGIYHHPQKYYSPAHSGFDDTNNHIFAVIQSRPVEDGRTEGEELRCRSGVQRETSILRSCNEP